MADNNLVIIVVMKKIISPGDHSIWKKAWRINFNAPGLNTPYQMNHHIVLRPNK